MCVFEESKRNDGLGLDTPRVSYFTAVAALEATGVPVLLVSQRRGLKLCRSMSSLRGTAAPSPQASSHAP